MAEKKDTGPGWLGIGAKKEKKTAETNQDIEEERDAPQTTQQSESSQSAARKKGYSPSNLAVGIFLTLVVFGIGGIFLLGSDSEENTAKSVKNTQSGSAVIAEKDTEQGDWVVSEDEVEETTANHVEETASKPGIDNGTSQGQEVEESPQENAALKADDSTESKLPLNDQIKETNGQSEGSIEKSNVQQKSTEKNEIPPDRDEKQSIAVDPEQAAEGDEKLSSEDISGESVPPTTDKSDSVEPSSEKTTVVDAERRPLLMEGKKTLFQRVLTRPGALLNGGSQDSGNTDDVWKEIDPFTIFFVFDRKSFMGRNWVEVGSSTSDPTEGWIDERQLIDWKQTLTVAFTNPAGRKRTLLFRDKDYLIELADSGDAVIRSEALRQTIQQGAIPEDFPVISIEPATHIDIQKQFYLLPILDAKEVFLASGFNVRALKIASVTLDEGDQDLIIKEENRKSLVQEAPKQEQVMTEFRAGVVFVIDSTTSMGPYIDRTREAVRQIYDKLKKADLLGQVSFGLVAYRDNMDKVPKLDYVSHVFGNLRDGERPSVLLEKISVVQPASVSSQEFVEDAFAGVLSAIEDMNWVDYDGRYLILITDAGARRGSDPLSATRMNAEQIRRLALDKGIATYCLHILSEAGKKNHESAATQYQTLSEYPAVGSLYYPVKDGSVQEFGFMTDMLAHTFVNQVIDASKGYVAQEIANTHSDKNDSSSTDSGKDQQHPEDSGKISEIKKKTLLVGRAMQLAYLGKEKGTQAPRLFEAWISDRDFLSPDTPTVDVNVLLTKNQLSDLQQTLKVIMRAGKSSKESSKIFFDELRSAAVALSRDPNEIGKSKTSRLGEQGLLGEYLDGLPYQSKVMSISDDLWSNWSIGEQQDFLDELEAKIRLYEEYHDDVDRWISLDAGRVPGDAVYPVPLDDLP